MNRARTQSLGLGLALSLACVSASEAQVRAPGEPPAAETAEAGLWDLSERAELEAKARADRNRDEVLNTYVSELTCKVAGDHCGDIRVYVMDRPILNASVAPNGFIEVWSGLLLRATTEDELAFVLGHEIGHFLEEHSLESLRQLKMTSTALLVVGMGTAAAGIHYQVDASALIDAVYLAGLSTYFNYNQKQESQSDEMGLARLHQMGLNPAAGANMWKNQQAETAASSFPRVRRSEAFGSVFRTHPLTRERIEALSVQGQALGQREITVEERRAYRAIIRSHLAAWINDEHRHRDYGRLLHLLQRLGADGEDLGLISYHRGEVYRRRREAGDEALALAAYRSAVAYEDAPAAAWRELGIMEARGGHSAAAREALTQYLEKAPTADDRWIIEDQLAGLKDKSDA